MDSLKQVEDVQELDYALDDEKDLAAAWTVLEAGMRKNGEETWTIAYEKHQVYRQRETASKWHKLMTLARTQEINIPVPKWMEVD